MGDLYRNIDRSAILTYWLATYFLITFCIISRRRFEGNHLGRANSRVMRLEDYGNRLYAP
jgi:hypothetical protein